MFGRCGVLGQSSKVGLDQGHAAQSQLTCRGSSRSGDLRFGDLSHLGTALFETRVPQSADDGVFSSLDIIVALVVQVDVDDIDDLAPLASEIGSVVARVSGLDESSGNLRVDLGTEPGGPGSEVVNHRRCRFDDLGELINRFALYSFTSPWFAFARLDGGSDFLDRGLNVKDIVLPNIDIVDGRVDVGDELVEIGRGVEGSRQSERREFRSEVDQGILQFDSGSEMRCVGGRVT